MAIVDTGLGGLRLRGRLDFEPGPTTETGGENPIRQWSES